MKGGRWGGLVRGLDLARVTCSAVDKLVYKHIPKSGGAMNAGGVESGRPPPGGKSVDYTNTVALRLFCKREL